MSVVRDVSQKLQAQLQARLESDLARHPKNSLTPRTVLATLEVGSAPEEQLNQLNARVTAAILNLAIQSVKTAPVEPRGLRTVDQKFRDRAAIKAHQDQYLSTWTDTVLAAAQDTRPS